MEHANIVQFLIPVAFAAGGWLLQSFLKLQTEFKEHQSSYGHKNFINYINEEFKKVREDAVRNETRVSDYVNEEFKRIREDLAKNETKSSVNFSEIENLKDSIKNVADGSKYRFRTHEGRLDILEEVMRREGYIIFKNTAQSGSEINKDTLDLEDQTKTS